MLKFKKFFLYILIGSLILSAIIAIITVLAGGFNEITTKIISTLAVIVFHSILILWFIKKESTEQKSKWSDVLNNILLFIVALSLITSLTAVWFDVENEIIWNLQELYLLLAFGIINFRTLSSKLNIKKYLDSIIYINYGIIIIAVFMILPIIFLADFRSFLTEEYFRILGAVGITYITLTLLIAIFSRSNPLQNNDDTKILD